jgi:hypothetical protein
LECLFGHWVVAGRHGHYNIQTSLGGNVMIEAAVAEKQDGVLYFDPFYLTPFILLANIEYPVLRTLWLIGCR